MYKIGDIVTCKKNFYLKKRRNIFSSPFLKKGKSYIITDIKKIGVTFAVLNSEDAIFYEINNYDVSDKMFKEFFYTKKDIRRYKILKLNEEYK